MGTSLSGGNIYQGSTRFISTSASLLNTFVGLSSGIAISTGTSNTAVGAGSLRANALGHYNTAFGSNALAQDNTGSNNTAVGSYSLARATASNDNTAVGTNALSSLIEGSRSVAIGTEALHQTTYAQGQTAVGYRALYSNTDGSYSTAVGFEAMEATTGEANTALGYRALNEIVSGVDDTAVGFNAGSYIQANFCTFIGAAAGSTLYDSKGTTNSTAIGYNTRTIASNQVRIGNSSVTSIGGYVGWTNLSDGRFKKNIQEDVPGLEFITRLKSVTYTLNLEGIEKAITANLPQGTNEAKPSEPSSAEIASRLANAKVVHTGFVAQEVEAAAKGLNYEFSGVDKPKNDKDFYGLRYSEFVVPLVKAVQELDEKTKRIEDLEKENSDIKSRLAKLEALLTNGNNPVTLTSAYLEQNTPNPVSGTTTIRYHISEQSTSARLTLTNAKGQVVKSFSLSNRGAGQVNLATSMLAAGTYTYTLWVDGRQADTKRLVIAR